MADDEGAKARELIRSFREQWKSGWPTSPNAELLVELAELVVTMSERVMHPSRWRRNRKPFDGQWSPVPRHIQWTIPASVVQWLETHKGAKLVLEARTIELCARKLYGWPEDDDRAVSCDGQNIEDVLGWANDLVEQMLDWELDNWEYSDEEFQAMVKALRPVEKPKPLEVQEGPIDEHAYVAGFKLS